MKKNKLKIAFYGASVTQQSINREGETVGYVQNIKKILSELLPDKEFLIYQLGYGSNHFNDAGYIYFEDLLKVTPDIVFLEWHSTGIDYFESEKYDYILNKLITSECKIINLILPLKRCIDKPERVNIQQSRWYQKKGVLQLNFYKLLSKQDFYKCIRDEVHTNVYGGQVYGSLIADYIFKIINNEVVLEDDGETISPTKTFEEAPKITSIELNKDLNEYEKLKIELSNVSSQSMQLFFKSRVGPFSPLLNIKTIATSYQVNIFDEWCRYERTVLKSLTKEITADISKLEVSISEVFPKNISKEFIGIPRKLKEIEKIYCVGGNILNIDIEKSMKKVLIFANCHGLIYQNALKEIDKEGILKIEHILSYENMGKYDDIKHKFSECDILIMQPVQNYEKFKIESIKKILKKDCHLIQVPFFRFNGYWDKKNVRELNKFTQPAVMFFPNIKNSDDVDNYIQQDLNTEEIWKIFNEGIEELRNLESQGDIQFVDFFLKNHQNIPMFRDPYHPTDIVYKYISSQITEIVRKANPMLSHKSFKLSSNWSKEYGHFKPIQNRIAEVLGLNYDLDSFFKFSRQAYLDSIIKYETDNKKKEIIDDLSQLNTLITSYINIEDKNVFVTKIKNGCIIFDKDWQYPAITEQYVFQKISDLPNIGNNNVYIAFPWATLIDKLNKQGKKASQDLFDVLNIIKKQIPKNKNVITVCQHILMLKFEEIFADVGITHVFWTHAVKGQTKFSKYQNIKIYPFPLYPVQAANVQKINYDKDRKVLYSFVGARSNQWYLTQSRSYIIDLLKDDSRGIVIGRDTWHFNKIVYDHQIEKNTDNKELIDDKATVEFKEIVQDSIFSLCPSGTGPNSIRLWESIGFGAIPVILADTYLPPGNQELWKEAVVFCEETQEAIQALPEHLEKLAQDKELLGRKRNAMKQLWMLYGPENFIYDIQKLFLKLDSNVTPSFMYNNFIEQLLDKNDDKDLLLTSLTSRILKGPEEFVMMFKSNSILRNSIEIALSQASENRVELFNRALQIKQISLFKRE
ncbi:WcbI family polysaccharide biosynthesis putative acetyltransferase [Sulfurimonas sp.]|uniref:WcbI family polysaccharide biosynthesis putative acetyltransferase n=1 Tax=Sulfurimonas sp. TaxID=2022749 RepID=UPI003D151155